MSNRSTAAELWSSTSRISNSRRKRVTAIQKSSRTITMHCTRSPSQCRRASTNSVFSCDCFRMKPLLELVEDDEDFLARRNPCPRRRAAMLSLRPRFPGKPGQCFRNPRSRAGFGVIGSRLDVDGNHCVGQPGQQPGLHQRRLSAARWPVDQAHAKSLARRSSLRSDISRSGCSPAVHPGPEGREEVPERNRRPGHRTTASPWGRSWRLAQVRAGRPGFPLRSVNRLHRRCLGKEMPQVFRHVESGGVTVAGPFRQGLQSRSFPVPWGSNGSVAVAGGVPGS